MTDLEPDCLNIHTPLFRIDIIEHAEAADPQFPGRNLIRTQFFAIARLYSRFVAKLRIDRFPPFSIPKKRFVDRQNEGPD